MDSTILKCSENKTEAIYFGPSENISATPTGQLGDICMFSWFIVLFLWSLVFVFFLFIVLCEALCPTVAVLTVRNE